MGKKLFVGGLSWNTDEEGLKETFCAFGELDEVKIVVDRETGRSRGFGFVTFSTPNEANEAIAKLDGTNLDGRTIRVSEAKERERR